MKSLAIFFSSIFLAIILLAGCAKQTLISKPYHNVTGKYNAYYNANLRVVESFDMLNKMHQDNYNKILEMYPYAAVEDVNAVKQPLDEAITKSARNIKLHEIGNWTDDSYQLMGEAEFHQRLFERAANTFKYIVDKYHPENVEKELEALRKNKKKGKKKKKRKKKSSKKKKNSNTDDEDEDDKPINYGLKHRPVRFKSMLWLAKTYIELRQYDEAGYYLRQLENDLTVPYKLRPRVQAVIAYNWIEQKEYEKAIEPLEKAIKGIKQKSIKNRYVYILGQIYQMQGNSQLAMENFHKVLRLKPSYEMEFNAKLNMAKNAADVKGKKVVDPEIALRRMLRDSKNSEFKDQIYFALAEIKLKSGKKEEGILALQESLNHGSNPAQRTEGCLLLAKLFFEKDDFIKSYAYYDSTLLVMNKSDERHTTTELYKNQLAGVAQNTALYLDKDSMSVVGSWDKKAQGVWAIKAMDADALATKNAFQGAGNEKVDYRNRQGSSVGDDGQPKRGSITNMNVNTTGITVNNDAIQKSKFALYNPSLKKKGEREFEKRWGNRSWVDHWRRNDKGDDEVNPNNAKDIAVVPKTQAEIEAYLQKRGVPKSDEEKKALEEKIGEAMFKAAAHYREDLGRNDKALQLVNDLVTKYPENDYAVEALFLAYNIHSEENNTSKATYYKEQILSKYPNTKIAKVLGDPDFANSETIKYQKINTYYNDTYSMIKEGKAEQALGRVRAVPTEFGDNYEMKARFAILEAMCIGGMKGEEDYIKALRAIVTSFPNTSEEKEAKNMIAILTGTKSTTAKNTVKNNPEENTELYKTDMNTKHIIMVVFDDTDEKVNQHRVPITEFNNKFYLSDKLSTSSILVDGNIPSLTIRAFQNGDLAMKYVVDARSNPEFLSGVKGFTIYAISQSNYNIALSTQKFKEYIPFFDKNYR